jgi:hypothetical protein
MVRGEGGVRNGICRGCEEIRSKCRRERPQEFLVNLDEKYLISLEGIAPAKKSARRMKE